MTKIRHKKDEGFTLVETVIAVVILGLALGVAAMTFNMAMRTVATSRNRMNGMHFARQEVERLRTFAFDDQALAAGDHAINRGAYVGAYTVTTVNSDLKDITLGVDWYNSMSNGVSAAVLTTYLAKALH